MTESIGTVLVPGIVAVLTAIGGVIGVQFRDADAYDRRRGIWLLMLVLLTTIATASAVDSASGVGRPVAAAALSTAAVGAAVGTHLLWRRVVFDAAQRTVSIATAATALAVVVIVAGVALTYVSGKGCRQAAGLVNYSVAQSTYILPTFDAGQGPTIGDFEKWSSGLRAEAGRVTDGDTAPPARRLAELSEQITAAVRDGDPGGHAVLGAQFYEELKTLVGECHTQ